MNLEGTALQNGDRIYRYYEAYPDTWEPQPLTVVRVNVKTVTVRTEAGSVFRMPPADIAGRWDDQ